jgi:hypothetical protein
MSAPQTLQRLHFDCLCGHRRPVVLRIGKVCQRTGGEATRIESIERSLTISRGARDAGDVALVEAIAVATRVTRQRCITDEPSRTCRSLLNLDRDLSPEMRIIRGGRPEAAVVEIEAHAAHADVANKSCRLRRAVIDAPASRGVLVP